MFLHREYYAIYLGRSREFEPRVSEMQGEMAKQSGFVAAYTLAYLGNSTRYLALRMWHRREDAQAWGRDPWFQSYLQARPAGLYFSPPEIEYYEQIAETHGDGAPGFVQVLTFSLAAGKARDFEARERDIGVVCRDQRGFVERRAFRFLGNTTKVLVASVWTGYDDRDVAAFSGPLAGFIRERPLRDLVNGPLLQEFYRVVDSR